MTRRYELERCEAVRVVVKACTVSRRVQDRMDDDEEEKLLSTQKADASPVTVADFAVQALLLSQLHKLFPEDCFIAEESSGALRADKRLLDEVLDEVNGVLPVPDHMTSDELCEAIDLGRHSGGDGRRTWVLDPIDGTKGFLRKEQYCVALGLLDHGRVRVGILGCPNLPCLLPGALVADIGTVFHAEQGHGVVMQTAEANPNTCVALPLDEPYPSSAVGIQFMESVESAHSSHAMSAKVAAVLGVVCPPIRMDSQAKYGVLARGQANIFMRFPKKEYIENIWDHAAGAIVLEEAGGTVTDGAGRPLRFDLGRKMDNDYGIVASNGIDHGELIRAVGEARCD